MFQYVDFDHNIFRLACVKLAKGLQNFKGVFARKCVASDDLSFTAAVIDKNHPLTLPQWKSLPQGVS